MIENLAESFLKGKGQSYAMHDMDQAMMFSTQMRFVRYDASNDVCDVQECMFSLGK